MTGGRDSGRGSGADPQITQITRIRRKGEGQSVKGRRQRTDD